MTEQQIRKTVLSFLPSWVKVVEEVCVGDWKRQARVDIATFTETGLHGIEIKSDADNLKRLNHQIESYAKVFCSVTVVSGPKWAQKVADAVPPWVGVVVAEEERLYCLRAPGLNPGRCKKTTLDLLWKTELTKILKDLGESRVGSKASLIARLSERPECEVAAIVAKALRDRPAWLRLTDEQKAQKRKISERQRARKKGLADYKAAIASGDSRAAREALLRCR